MATYVYTSLEYFTAYELSDLWPILGEFGYYRAEYADDYAAASGVPHANNVSTK